MRRDGAMIEMEYRREVSNILDVITDYVKRNPDAKNNETLRELYHLLDQMEMEW